MCVLQENPDLPDTGGTCCYGAGVYGPGRCTCWVPEYDLEQADLDPMLRSWVEAGVKPNTRQLMCQDCAYRPGSPERTGTDGYNGDADELEALAALGRPFFCHQGIRKPVRLRHPSGPVIDGHAAAYSPPITAGVPWRADGTPAELCAGWAARRRALGVSDA